jgi:hypothetical protein
MPGDHVAPRAPARAHDRREHCRDIADVGDVHTAAHDDRVDGKIQRSVHEQTDDGIDWRLAMDVTLRKID